MTATALAFKSLDSTPLPELQEERDRVDATITQVRNRGQRPHPTLYDALLAYDAVIARRMREAPEHAA